MAADRRSPGQPVSRQGEERRANWIRGLPAQPRNHGLAPPVRVAREAIGRRSTLTSESRSRPLASSLPGSSALPNCVTAMPAICGRRLRFRAGIGWRLLLAATTVLLIAGCTGTAPNGVGAPTSTVGPATSGVHGDRV